MKTLERYITAAYLKNFLMAIFALCALFFFQAYLSAIYESKFSREQLLIYHLLNLPHTLVQMAPPAILIATVFTLSGMSRFNELVACYSIGVPLKKIFSLLVMVTFMISCLMLVLQDRILPLTYKKRTNFYWHEMKKQPDFFLDIKQNKVWYRSKNIIYNLRLFDPNRKIIYGMSVYTFDNDFNLLELVNAERAEFSPNGWRLMDGTVTLFNRDDPFPMTQKFSEKSLVISETPKDFQEIEKEVKGLRLKDLYRYIARIKQVGADTKNFEVEFHSKISLSFISVVMCMLGVPFSVRSRREGGVAKDLGLGLVVTFFYWLFHSISLSMGTNGALPPILAAWLPSMIFAGLAVTLIARRST